MEGDFVFNGIPIYNIDINDFLIISDSAMTRSRMAIKNLNNQTVADRIRKNNMNMGVCFEGIVIDFREFKNTDK